MKLDATTDAVALAAIHARAFEAPWNDAAFTALLAGPGVFALVVADLGMILCRTAGGEAEILTVAVDPMARRRGVGRALTAAALGLARQAGAEAAFLEVADDNPAARALYADLGFREAGVRKGYYAKGADAVVMRLDLAAARP